MKRKLKIAQVVSLHESVPPISQNGLEFVVSWLTEELVARGHDVTLFAPGDSKTSAKLVSLLPEALFRKHRQTWQFGFFSIWNTLTTTLQKEPFDIIHCHNSNASFIAPFVDSKLVETLHSPFNEEFLSLCKNENKNGELQVIINQVSKVHHVAISKKQEQDYVVAEEVYLKNHACIHNGIPVEQFEFNDKPKDYLLFIGYINKNKGADIAVQVAHKLGMRLILAGSNATEEVFFKEHIEPYLSEKIQYVGKVDFAQKNKLYKNAIAKLAPIAWHEPFGLTIVEAQACGTPVIAFDKGAAAEIIKDGETGFIVNTEREMIEAVKKISGIDRKKCRAWVEENFSVKKMVDEYEKYYYRIINT